MNLKNNYQKFKKHLKTGGLFYAIWRGIKYFIYLGNKQRDEFKQTSMMDTVTKGRLRIVCSGSGINIFWNSFKITEAVGLNVVVNTLGLWTDSSRADWHIIEKGTDFFKAKVVFRELPLSQTWIVKIDEEYKISWQVSMEIEEYLHIDEIRLLCMMNSRYKAWINNYREENFPRLSSNWQDLCLDNASTSLVGVRFPTEGEFLPSFSLELQNDRKDIFPIIQNPPSYFNAHIIGFRYSPAEGKRDYSPRNYHLFSTRINLYEKDKFLDNKMESLRQDYFEIVKEGKKRNGKSKRIVKVLLINLPWQKDGRWGVRAGSRWPHIKDRSEGNYLPFPFFLAYAVSLLRKNDIEADLIDAIAEEIAEDKLIERLSHTNYDILVAETSVPSFHYDIELLRKISSLGIPIVLCGPHSGIYKRELLKEYSFIDFVLFGEYEVTLLELIQNIIEGNNNFSSVKGLVWRNSINDIIVNPPREPFDINILPWPYRETLPMEKYWDLPGNIPYPSVQMVASRGCPFGCNFCLWPQVLYGGRNYRVRDINDVVDEMEYLIREKGFKSIYFDDDTFNIGKERMINLSGQIIKRGLNTIPWAIMARADLMDEEILDNLKKAGLWAIKYGVESSSQKLLNKCGKNIDLKKIERVIKFTKSLGIKVHLTFLFGLEGETRDVLKKTIDYSLTLDPHSVQYTILTPFPGTKLFDKLDREGRILTYDWSLYDGHHSCVFRPANFSSSYLEKTKQYAYRVWADYQRRKRGFWGNVKRFFEYSHKYGLSGAIRKTNSYLNYIYHYRKQFIGKI